MFRGQGKPLCDVTSEPRPEAETGTQENRAGLVFDVSDGRSFASQSSLQADGCSKFSICFKAHNAWGYILILLYPCLYLSQAPGVMWPAFTSLTRH